MVDVQERLWCPMQMEDVTDYLRSRLQADCDRAENNCKRCRHAVTIRCLVFSGALKRGDLRKLYNLCPSCE